MELLLSMMMVDDSKHTKIPRCKFHNSGFCKFREQCRKRHFSSVCQVPNCNQDCQARHPRLYKLEINCKFWKKGICAYKHITPTNDNKLEDLEKELKSLKNEIKDLTEQINSEKSEIIKKLSQENHKIKIYIEEIKQTHAKAIEVKNSEVKKLQVQNDHQKKKIVDLSTQERKLHCIQHIVC